MYFYCFQRETSVMRTSRTLPTGDGVRDLDTRPWREWNLGPSHPLYPPSRTGEGQVGFKGEMSGLRAWTIQRHKLCGQATGLPPPPSSQDEIFVAAGMGLSRHRSRDSPEGAGKKEECQLEQSCHLKPVNPRSGHSAFLSPTSTTLIQTARNLNLPMEALDKPDKPTWITLMLSLTVSHTFASPSEWEASVGDTCLK